MGMALARSSPLPSLRYDFHIVNLPEANTETFPGGHVYIDRGLVEMAANEHELAALLAHEIAHAAARHGTRQLSGQLLVQAPTSVLGGLARQGAWKEHLGRLGINLSARSTFLRYSREQEIEANRIAAGILVKSEYSPYALASVLRKLNRPAAANKTSLPGYAFNHPQSEETLNLLDQEIERHRPPQRVLSPGFEFFEFQGMLAKLSWPVAADSVLKKATEAELPEEYRHPEDYYRLRFPQEWQQKATSVNGAMIWAPGGLRSTMAEDDLRTGVLFDLFPMPERQMTLEQATNRLLVFLRQRNQELRPIAGAQSQTLMGAEPALRTIMIANSRPAQVVWVVTRQYYDSLFYVVCVAPEDDFPDLQPVFENILRSVEMR
jgi:hypothetical protein